MLHILARLEDTARQCKIVVVRRQATDDSSVEMNLTDGIGVLLSIA